MPHFPSYNCYIESGKQRREDFIEWFDWRWKLNLELLARLSDKYPLTSRSSTSCSFSAALILKVTMNSNSVIISPAVIEMIIQGNWMIAVFVASRIPQRPMLTAVPVNTTTKLAIPGLIAPQCVQQCISRIAAHDILQQAVEAMPWVLQWYAWGLAWSKINKTFANDS